jgi:outer membrane protein OmpA-like peptidoglycan-associated protein
MTIARIAAVALLVLGLSACATVRSARDRIVRPSARCADQTVEVYFEQFSAEISKEGRQVIAAAAQTARPCRVTGVDVLGLADSVGGDQASNLELSKKRARAVTEALTASSLPDAKFQVAAAGEAGAVTAKGQAAPMRRRVDIVLHLAPR